MYVSFFYGADMTPTQNAPNFFQYLLSNATIMTARQKLVTFTLPSSPAELPHSLCKYWHALFHDFQFIIPCGYGSRSCCLSQNERTKKGKNLYLFAIQHIPPLFWISPQWFISSIKFPTQKLSHNQMYFQQYNTFYHHMIFINTCDPPCYNKILTCEKPHRKTTPLK